MGTINIRIDDSDHELLRACAMQEQMSLSEFCRNRLLDAIAPRALLRSDDPGDMSPDTLAPLERHQLALLHRILAQVLPEDADGEEGRHQHERMAQAMEEGFTAAYYDEFIALDPELSQWNCGLVIDILSMFDQILASAELLGLAQPGEISPVLEFGGFDHNDRLEAKMHRFVRYMVADGDWERLQPYLQVNKTGNSHHPVLARYERMLAEYRRIIRTQGRLPRPLTREELDQIAAAAVHPDNR